MKSSSTPTTFRKPRQQRSRESLSRIVQAAEDLLSGKGPEAVTVSRVTQKAGVSVGSFYARFEGKDALLEHLGERLWEERREAWEEFLSRPRWRRRPLPDLLRSIVRALVRGNARQQARLRSLALSACLNPESSMSRRTAELNEFLVDRVKGLLMDRKGEFDHPDPERAAGFGIRLVLGALQQQVIFAETAWNPFDLSSSELIEELTRCWVEYLGVKAPSPTVE
ncbi:MAG TPA: TetR/AcrR family transcriptional regulator [Acidobacteriota bacterium]|nr:TetR/AcrR family transcriptional regulator [Acidobacteriota bacterium]